MGTSVSAIVQITTPPDSVTRSLALGVATQMSERVVPQKQAASGFSAGFSSGFGAAIARAFSNGFTKGFR